MSLCLRQTHGRWGQSGIIVIIIVHSACIVISALVLVITAIRAAYVTADNLWMSAQDAFAMVETHVGHVPVLFFSDSSQNRAQCVHIRQT